MARSLSLAILDIGFVAFGELTHPANENPRSKTGKTFKRRACPRFSKRAAS